ncbi:hypothetical protein J3E69DRAFT_333228 [Trichoderma sp. SZMC 28015]
MQRTHAQAQRKTPPVKPKIRVIKKVSLGDVSEIKLKRTDTTLDLSQKAKRAEEEKKKKGKWRGALKDFIVVGSCTLGGGQRCSEWQNGWCQLGELV